MNIFEFTDYQAFLRSFIAALPKKGWGFSQKLSEALNIHPSHVSQVVSGHRDFSVEQAIAVSEFVGLSSLETDYFVGLVNIHRAGTPQAKNYYRKKVQDLKKLSLNLSQRMKQDKILSEEEKSIFYSSYIYSAVRLFCSLEGGVSLEQIKERFDLTSDRLREILDFLLRVGLVVQNSGIFTMGTQHTHVEKGSPHLSRHHMNWRVQALERVENISEEELQFTSPISISRKDFERVREVLVKTINDSFTILKASPAEDVACINLDLFWIKK